ncbi:hypothetical protein [Streptosporangium sp. NPDC048865]|uniref:hypothetical protein n=1 Tax=Streptosporangium sp. NPDC048865 TaxID=3155766 RepID=UPI00343F6177
MGAGYAVVPPNRRGSCGYGQAHAPVGGRRAGHELTRNGRPRHHPQRFEAVLEWWSRHLS